MQKHLYNFIYKTTNLKNNRFYIGMHSTSNLDDGYIGSGRELRNSVRYWGKENHFFEILEFLPDRDSLSRREREIVNEDLLNDPKCMNVSLGGSSGGFISEEHQIKCSKAGNEKFKTLIQDEEYKKEFARKTKGAETWKSLHQAGKVKYDTFTGRTHSEESKEKIGKANSELQQGEKNSQFGKVWICNLSQNRSIKISKEEIDKYISLGWNPGRINNNPKIDSQQVLFILEKKKEGLSERKIADLIGTSRTTISKILRGETYKIINIAG